jgi:segregation and condensation protein B
MSTKEGSVVISESTDPRGASDAEARELKPSRTDSRNDAASETAGLAADIEAMLISSGRSLSAARLAVALGLIDAPAGDPGTKDSATNRSAGDDPALADEAPQDPTAVGAGETTGVAAPAKKTRSKRRASEDPSARAESLVASAVASLNEEYERSGRSFRVESVSGGYRVMTLPAHAKAVAALAGERDTAKLSRPGVETLAIIAYRQPVTRAELEAIRGVACGEVLRSLMERRLVAIVGRAEELGRPMLYGTTRHFLEAFGLSSLKDLPTPAEFKGGL